MQLTENKKESSRLHSHMCLIPAKNIAKMEDHRILNSSNEKDLKSRGHGVMRLSH